MGISRQLYIALLVSFIWHLFWMSAVTIVFLPGKFKLAQYSSISFLGSILQGSIAAPEAAASTLAGAVLAVPAEIDIRLDLKDYAQPLQVREIPHPDSFINVDEPIEKKSIAASFVSAKAIAPKREILYRPALTKYPEWTGQELKVRSATFKIYISADGLVQELVCLQASGNPEIDAALARYIERWRFAPVAGLQGQWQTVEINLDFNEE